MRVVGPAPTVEDASRLIADEGAPHGAVLDVNLGGAPVYPLADALRERNVPFVFLTGYDCPNLPLRFGSNVCLEKPSAAAVVVARVAAEIKRQGVSS